MVGTKEERKKRKEKQWVDKKGGEIIGWGRGENTRECGDGRMVDLEWIWDSHWMDGEGRGRGEFVREGGEREAWFR